jgi:hypothetical protein
MSGRYDIHPMEAKFRKDDAERKALERQLDADWKAVVDEGHGTEYSLFKRGFHLGANYDRSRRATPADQSGAAPSTGDAEMLLDWLESREDFHIDYFLREGKTHYIIRCPAWGRALGHGPTVRAAIRSAMAGGAK